jgi:putative thiamine transport system ATP-binding protein
MGRKATLEHGVMLELRHVSLAIASRILVQPFSMMVKAGDIATLMGPSGTGKSSILSYIGGDLPDVFTATGDVLLSGQSLVSQPSEQRRIGRLFQDDLLFPHMTVGENLLFATPRLPKAERLAMVATALERAELSGFESRPPHTLSGGQRQRVALMRALLAKPAAILLDEPFSKLDKSLRGQMRDYVFSHIKARGIPALLVTHDREDAPSGGRILEIFDDGMVRDV